MALDIVAPYPGTREKIVSATEQVLLGAGDDDTVSTFAVHVVLSGFSGSFTPKQRSTGARDSGGVLLAGANLIPCIYYTNASETAIAAGASSNTNGVYYIPTDGCETILDFTVAAGTATLYIRKLRG